MNNLPLYPGSLDPEKESYQLVFNDEFDDARFDRSKWSESNQPDVAGQRRSYMGGWPNISQSNGEFTIKATYEKDKVINGQKYDYQSAWIQTIDKFTGPLYIEARMKLPSNTKWMQTMFDIIPTIPDRYASWLKSMTIRVIATWQDNGTFLNHEIIYGGGGDVSRTVKREQNATVSDYHMYAFAVKDDRVQILVDGEVIAEKLTATTLAGQDLTGNQPFDIEFQPRLGIAFRGIYTAGLAEALPQQIVIDYIRVYKPVELSDEEIYGNAIRGRKMRLIQG